MKIIISFLFLVFAIDLFSQSDEIEIVGIIHSDQMRVLTNSEKRDSYYFLTERYIVIHEDLINEYKHFNDTIVLNLLREHKAFVGINDCFNLLNDVFHKFEGNDSVLDWLQQSYPIKFIEHKDGSFFCVIEENINYVDYHSVMIDDRYSFQNYNTECFLLVSAPYNLCFKRQPLLNFGDGIFRDFWLEPESNQRVTVIIPLICRN